MGRMPTILQYITGRSTFTRDLGEEEAAALLPDEFIKELKSKIQDEFYIISAVLKDRYNELKRSSSAGAKNDLMDVLSIFSRDINADQREHFQIIGRYLADFQEKCAQVEAIVKRATL